MDIVYLVIENHNNNVLTICEYKIAAEYEAKTREKLTGNTCRVSAMPISHASIETVEQRGSDYCMECGKVATESCQYH